MTRGNKNKCYYCGVEEKCTKDHFIPKSRGGNYTVYACSYCQETKLNLYPLNWIDIIKWEKLYDEQTIERIKRAVFSLYKLAAESKIKL